MESKKKNIILITEFLLVIIQIVSSIIFKNIHMRTMTEGAKIIINKYNFLSSMTWGNGNYFPILFVISLILAGIIILLELLKNEDKEAKRSLNIVLVGGILFILIPIALGMQLMNLGLAAMFICQMILLLLNLLKVNI